MDFKLENFFEEFDFPSYEQWKAEAEAALKGAPFDKLMFTDTYENIRIKPIYNSDDLPKDNTPSLPGVYPFRRSNNITGYKKRPWEISQIIPYADSNEFNKALKNDLANGQNSIRINISRAIAMYEDFNEDDISGQDNLIADIHDLTVALSDINCKNLPIHVDAGLAFLPAFALLNCYFDQNDFAEVERNGSVVADPIRELCIEGSLPVSIESYYDEMFLVTQNALNLPNFRTITIDTNHVHNQGGSAVHEIAYASAVLVEYLTQMTQRGININHLANKIIVSFSIGTNFFLEIAKLRAARIVFANIFREFGANPDNSILKIHVYTSERDTTYFDPHVNMLRATSQVFSSVLGGIDIITVNNYDMTHGIPTEFSRRIARNIQNVLLYESHLTDTIDPAGGSYYIESLTNGITEKSWEAFKHIEAKGGIIHELVSGELFNQLIALLTKRYDNVSIRKDVIVGTNKYPLLDEREIPVMDLENSVIEEFVDNYDKKILERDIESIDNVLDRFEETLLTKSPTAIDFAVEAFKLGACMAEVYNSLIHDVENQIKIEPFKFYRLSSRFEELRFNSIHFKEQFGKFPELPLICIGKLKEFKLRADFSNDFFKVGGFDCFIIDGFEDAENINVDDIPEHKAYVFCSTDDLYSQFIPRFAAKLKEKYPSSYTILAGYPKDMVDTYKNAGIDDFIHIKSNVFDSLIKLQEIYHLTQTEGV